MAAGQLAGAFLSFGEAVTSKNWIMSKTPCLNVR